MKRPKPPRIVLGENVDRFDDFGQGGLGSGPTALPAEVPIPASSVASTDAITDTTVKSTITRLPERTHRNLRLLAAQRATSIQALMLEAIALLGTKYGTNLSQS